tara:strand:- start:565 stop:1287 length:723 start_codon:yes stop_codon:yes gene_type:complete
MIVSCSSKKDILFVQDLKDSQTFSIDYNEYEIKVDDILKIDVFAENTTLTLEFNRNNQNFNAQTKESMVLNGYQVNSLGYINFPSLGKLKVEGLTVSKTTKLIYESIVNNGFLLNPTVDVKVINSSFTILGEVNRPGRYDFIKNNMDIIQAIAMAGDLTINGQRKNIKIIRNYGDKKSVSTIDLTKSDFFTSTNFQIFSGDIIIVDPNNTRVKNAGIIGNSGTLLSLLSFLLSSFIVMNN